MCYLPHSSWWIPNRNANLNRIGVDSPASDIVETEEGSYCSITSAQCAINWDLAVLTPVFLPAGSQSWRTEKGTRFIKGQHTTAQSFWSSLTQPNRNISLYVQVTRHLPRNKAKLRNLQRWVLQCFWSLVSLVHGAACLLSPWARCGHWMLRIWDRATRPMKGEVHGELGFSYGYVQMKHCKGANEFQNL